MRHQSGVLDGGHPGIAACGAGLVRNQHRNCPQRGLSALDRIGYEEQHVVMNRIGELERKYVLEVLDTDFRSSKGGAMTKRLEEAFAALCGCRFAIAHDNGTSTLHAALLAAGVGIGDEVIVPPLTMAS